MVAIPFLALAAVAAHVVAGKSALGGGAGVLPGGIVDRGIKDPSGIDSRALPAPAVPAAPAVPPREVPNSNNGLPGGDLSGVIGDITDLLDHDFFTRSAEKKKLVPYKRHKMRQARRKVAINIDINIQIGSLLDDAIETVTKAAKKIESLLDSITTLAESEVKSLLSPLLDDITEAIKTVSTGLDGISGSSSGPTPRTPERRSSSGSSSDQAIAQQFTKLLTLTANSLNDLEGVTEQVPIVGTLLDPVYTLLNPLLSKVVGLINNLVTDVLSIVAGLLRAVSGLPLIGSLLNGAFSDILGPALDGILGSV